MILSSAEKRDRPSFHRPSILTVPSSFHEPFSFQTAFGASLVLCVVSLTQRTIAA
jgi:hypothetical protein